MLEKMLFNTFNTKEKATKWLNALSNYNKMTTLLAENQLPYFFFFWQNMVIRF